MIDNYMIGYTNIYKRNINLDIGRLMREKYENGMIINESQFREELDNVLSDS